MKIFYLSLQFCPLMLAFFCETCLHQLLSSVSFFIIDIICVTWNLSVRNIFSHTFSYLFNYLFILIWTHILMFFFGYNQCYSYLFYCSRLMFGHWEQLCPFNVSLFFCFWALHYFIVLQGTPGWSIFFLLMP